MAVVDGKVILQNQEGQLFQVPPEEAEIAQRDQGWTVAPDDVVAQRQAEREKYSQFGSTGQQAAAAADIALQAATLGAAPRLVRPEQEEVLREHSPVVAGVAQAAGSLVPALAAGAVGGAALGAAGLSEGAVAAGSAALEGVAGGLSDEIVQARAEARDVSAGNVFLYGLGGELVGRALPLGLQMGAGRIKRALTAGEAAVGEGLTDALVTAEERAVKSQATLARELPKDSAERLAALKATAPQQYDRMATEMATDLDEIMDAAGRMGDTSASKRVEARLRETIADEAPAQTDWFTGQKQSLSEAKKAIRAPLEDTRPPPTMEEWLAEMPEARRQRALDDLSTEVAERARKAGIDATAGSEDWDRIAGDVLAEKTAPRRTQSLADTPGLQGFAKRYDQIVDSGLRRLDKTTDNVEQFLIARDVKKQLQQLSKKMSVTAPQDAVLHDELRAVIDDSWRGLGEGLKDKSLFGAAADIEADINQVWHDKILRGVGITEQDLARKVDVDFRTGRTQVEFDPKKARSFLQGDAIDRKIAQDKLNDVLDGAEELLAAHERHGTWSPDEIAKQRQRIARARENLALADELQVAKSAPEPGAAKAPKAEKTVAQELTDKAKNFAVKRAAGAAGGALGALVGGPVGGALGWAAGEGLEMAISRRLVGIDQAARSATKQAARNLAGVGIGYAERAAGNVATGRAGALAAVPATTALARFTGDYAGPQESFEAKRKILDQELTAPDVLYEVLGNSLGDLPKVAPELYQQITQRTAQKVRFVRDNLPPGLQASLLYPNGTPPSQSDLRDFAVLWNTVMDPETVLQDLNAGTATPQQMRILQQSDPDLYEQLRGDVIEQVGTHFKDVPTPTKLQLDLLFDADGLAGPVFSSDCARYVGDAQKLTAEQRQAAPTPSGNPKAPSSAQPSGLNAIQTSVTNRQAA